MTPGPKVSGFTLIELLVVITLVLALMGIMATWGLKYLERGYIARTQSLITRLVLECEQLKERTNRFPSDGFDSEVETESGTKLTSGAALVFALSQPVKLTRVTASGRQEEIGMADPIGNVLESELELHPEDEQAAEVLDAWGWPLFYDNVAKGESAFTEQESLDTHLGFSSDSFLPDPRTDPKLVERTGLQNTRGVDIWSFGPQGNSEDASPGDYVGNWSKKNQAE